MKKADTKTKLKKLRMKPGTKAKLKKSAKILKQILPAAQLLAVILTHPGSD